ncbi:MAG: hypothetical protein U0P45_11255 [Acidimicrobiales bacterium]
MAQKKKTRGMTDEHKAALAEGRAQGRAVRVYLEALEANNPKRGRKRTPDSIKKRLDRVTAELETADPLKRLQLTQEQLDLEAELAAGEQTVDLAALEQDFIASAAGYAKRKGISYSAFRAVGVPPAVLRSAGISRGACGATVRSTLGAALPRPGGPGAPRRRVRGRGPWRRDRSVGRTAGWSRGLLIRRGRRR